MSTISALIDIADFLNQFSLNFGTVTAESNDAYLTIWNAKNLTRTEMQNLKRAFTRLKAQGNPPNVVLVGRIRHGNTDIHVSMYGGFECKVISEKQILKEIPEVPYSPARIETATVYEWSCDPAKPTEETEDF